jgi:hypothetical protein
MIGGIWNAFNVSFTVVADHAWRIKTDFQCQLNQPCGQANLLRT